MRSLFTLAPLAAALVLAASPAPAADVLIQAMQTEGVHVGNGVICDTQDEVSRFVKSQHELGASRAIEAVNRNSPNPAACGLATIAFEHGRELGNLRTDQGSYIIMQIDIVAAATNDGAWHQIARQTQFTAVKLEGLDI